MAKKKGKLAEVAPFPHWKEAVPLYKPGRTVPVVFMFQPTHYRVVSTPKELQLWEQMMIERVGFERNSPILKRGPKTARMMRGRETISGKAPMTMDD